MKTLIFLGRFYTYLISFCSVLCLVSCQTSDNLIEDDRANKQIVSSCEVKGIVPQEPKGKINVYDAMARAAKYNVGVMTERTFNKIYSVNSSVTPKEILTNLLSSSNGQDNKVYNALRALDYAILYATASMSQSSLDVHDDILETSAQNLALAAIKAHNDMLFTEKQDPQLVKLIAKNKDEIKDLEDKSFRMGKLSPEEYEYKKALDVNVYKLNNFHDIFLARQVEYRNLIKDKSKNPQLDGRKFYELDSLDKKLNAQIFQKAALRYRNEFKLMTSKEYSFEGISRYLALTFDSTQRLDVNEYDKNNPLFVNAMEKQADVIANKLIDSVAIYQNNTLKGKFFQLKENVFDNLSAAIFAQIELAYNMVKMIELDLEETNKQIKTLKKDIASLKSHDLPLSQKMDLLEKQTNLFSLEMSRSQIIGEKAVAIRALYFYAGYAPFNCPTLNMPPENIARILKDGFNREVVRMLANISEEKPSNVSKVNDWAKGENWLENLLNKKKNGDVSSKTIKPKTAYDLYVGEEYNKRKIMQLGAYKNVKTAYKDWEILKDVYPQLSRYKPVIVRNDDDGKVLNRLLIKSSDGGFRDLCNELRRDKVQCILK